jgi:hypothetical protein
MTDAIPEFGVCRTCGVKYIPAWLDRMGKFSSVCGTCGLAALERFLASADEDPEQSEPDQPPIHPL